MAAEDSRWFSFLPLDDDHRGGALGYRVTDLSFSSVFSFLFKVEEASATAARLDVEGRCR